MCLVAIGYIQVHCMLLFCRFRPVVVKEIIHRVLKEALFEKQYSDEGAKQWSKEISDTIQEKLKGSLKC